jgi:hypothetical protein
VGYEANFFHVAIAQKETKRRAYHVLFGTPLDGALRAFPVTVSK